MYYISISFLDNRTNNHLDLAICSNKPSISNSAARIIIKAYYPLVNAININTESRPYPYSEEIWKDNFNYLKQDCYLIYNFAGIGWYRKDYGIQ